MSEPLVILEAVRKEFPKARQSALEGLSAVVRPGCITGLVGPDGAGKTTLMRLMAGLLVPTSGTIRVGGLDPIQDAEKLRELIGYMPQKFGLYEDLSVQENLDLHADLRGVVGAERTEVFGRLLAFTDLARFTDRLAGKLSGGMKQKLGLACALLGIRACCCWMNRGWGWIRFRGGNCGRWSMSWWGRGWRWCGARRIWTRRNCAPRFC